MKRFLLASAAVLLAACAGDIQNTEAVKQGVLEYLKARTAQTGLDVNLMQVDVSSVSFQGGTEARATVSFRPKGGGDGGGPMTMNYTLDRKGNKWVVRGRTENGAHPHGTPAPGTNLPQLAPVQPGGQPPPAALPPGHPPIGSKK